MKKSNQENPINLYVGCGPDAREGFIHCDLRELPHVDCVCKAWEVSRHFSGVSHIYSRHMLEHLTNAEAMLTLEDWYKALALNATVRIIVPNMDFHCQQWLQAEWNEDTFTKERSDALYSSAGFWGWQAECDPLEANYNNSYWDVHKSGYNVRKMKFLMEKIGFSEVHCEIKGDVHLVTTAKKTAQ